MKYHESFQKAKSFRDLIVISKTINHKLFETLILSEEFLEANM